MVANKEHAINIPFYQWSVKAFSILRRRLGMTMNTYDDANALQDGQIFLFNHFARFETIIPQYFIYKATGAYCRCVATHELFEGSERFAKVLWGAGAVPNNHPGLLPFLAAEILRGRKVIIFPEGSMMKDRSVAAPPRQGLLKSWASYSGHRQGAAALGVTLEIFKKRILSVLEEGDEARLGRWVSALGLKDKDELIAAARKPTLVVPSNITFYPLRTEDNILRKAADFFHLDLGKQATEELLIEGNLILRNTDMDIRFGTPIHPDLAWSSADRLVLKQMFEQIEDLGELFGLKDQATHWLDKMAATSVQRTTRRLRDLCMIEMYSRVTVNINHLASKLLLQLTETGQTEIDHRRFGALLYRLIKEVQRQPGLYLHRTVTDADFYAGLHGGDLSKLSEFFATAQKAGLITLKDKSIGLNAALGIVPDGRDARLENSIRVYANEVSSLTSLSAIVERAVPAQPSQLAQSLFDDEWRRFLAARKKFSEPPYTAVNDLEGATQSGEPFLMLPSQTTRPGVVLVHGLLSSPAEMRSFAKKLYAEGYPVIGVRLAGHGTSPWDLREMSWMDWLASVRRSYEIMAHTTKQVVVIGTGTGAALALHFAAEKPAKLAGVVSVAAPLKLRQRYPLFAPLMDGVSKLASWVHLQGEVKPFLVSEPQHPEFEYRHMPYRTLVCMRKMVEELMPVLPEVSVRTIILQAADDPVVHPESASLLADAVGAEEKSLHFVTTERHGILTEDVGDTQGIILKALDEYGGRPLRPTETPTQLLARMKLALSSAVTPWLDRLKRGHAS